MPEAGLQRRTRTAAGERVYARDAEDVAGRRLADDGGIVPDLLIEHVLIALVADPEAILELQESRPQADPQCRTAAPPAQLPADDHRRCAALDPAVIVLRELLRDDVVGRRAVRRNRRHHERHGDGADAAAAGAGLHLLRENLGGGRGGEFADRRERLVLVARIEVAELDATAVVDPAALVAVAPGHPGPHPARVEVELEGVGPEEIDPADDVDIARARRREARVVELDEGLRRDRRRRDQVAAYVRATDLADARRGDRPVEPIVREEHALGGLLVDPVLLQVRRREELEVVEVLIRKERHPVATADRRHRSGKRRRQSDQDRRHPPETSCGSHRGNVLWSRLEDSADADSSSDIGRAGRSG